MYRCILCLQIIVFLTTGSMVAQNQVTVSYTDAECNFGLFPSSNPIKQADIIITCQGDGTLQIESVMTACSCTTVEYKKRPINPGCTDTISITYNGTDRWPGEFSRSLLIKSNAINSPTRVVLKGYMYDDSGTTLLDSTIFKQYTVYKEPQIKYVLTNK